MKIDCGSVAVVTLFGGLASGITAMAVDTYGGPSLQEIFGVGDSPIGSMIMGFGFAAALILVFAGMAKSVQLCCVTKSKELVKNPCGVVIVA